MPVFKFESLNVRTIYLWNSISSSPADLSIDGDLIVLLTSEAWLLGITRTALLSPDVWSALFLIKFGLRMASDKEKQEEGELRSDESLTTRTFFTGGS